MKKMKKCILMGLAMSAAILLAGCGQEPQTTAPQTQVKVDINRPLSDIQAEAQALDVAQLRSAALKYKDAILDQQQEWTKIEEQLKAIPLTEALGEQAKKLKAEMENLQNAIKALKDRFDVYYNMLRDKGADVKDLEIK